MRIFKNPFLGKKRWNYFLPVFKAPKKMDVTIFGPFLSSSCFAVSSASSKRVPPQNPIFIGFFEHLLKHLVTSCSNYEVNPEPPPEVAGLLSLKWPKCGQIIVPTASNSMRVSGPHLVPGREVSELLMAYYLCAKANSPSFCRIHPFCHNSLSFLFRERSRNSTPPVS